VRGALPSLALGALLAGCRQDMHDQPKYEPYEKSDFFEDHRTVRPQLTGTVARGQLHEDAAFFTGKREGAFVAALPIPLTEDTLRRGRERFDIYCTPCHGRVGRGDGMVVRRGFQKPPSFHEERLRVQPVGYFYDVITNGFGAMSDYAAQIPVRDRWAIAAYVRALQLSQNARVTDVPAEHRRELESP
jgi:mono/diheme cytochrome c family protein